MSTKFLAPLFIIVVALAAVFVGGDGHIGQRAEAATATAVGIDLETSDNTATSMGTISTCRSVNAGDFFDVDIYVTGVSGGVQGFDTTLHFFAGAVKIPSDGEGGALNSNLLLAEIAGSNVVDYSDERGVVITGDGIWAARAYDSSGPATAEDGDGVLTRIRFKAVSNGTSALHLAVPGIGPILTGGDGNPIGPHTEGIFTGTITGAQIYVGSPCPGTNSAPTATTTTGAVYEDIPAQITLQGSDTEGICPLLFAITSGTTNGNLGSLSTPTCISGNASAKIYYAPDANVCSPTGDSFQYTVTDGPLTSSPSTVTVYIICQNDAPSVSATSASTLEDNSVVIPLEATDIDNDCGLTFSAATTPSKGSLGSFSTTGCTPDTPVAGTSTSTGQVTYTPNLDSNGADLFQFKATDASDDSAPAVVSIDVTPVPDPPQADDKSVTTSWNTAKVITLTASDVDEDDCPLTFSVVSGPGDGSLGSISESCTNGVPTVASGTVTYSPDPTLAGSDSFTYKVTDPALNESNVATVDITVNQTDNDADGLLDHLEALPSNNCAPFGLAADADGDGLTDGQEVILLGTRCDKADTDGDAGKDSLEMSLTGTATGATSNTLGDVYSSYPQPPASPTSTWAAGQWNGFFVTITGGTGAGQIRRITGNTATTLSIDPANPWTTVPNSTSTYAIHKVQTLPLVACAADTVPNNEDPDPQPADLNDDRSVNILDTFKLFPAWLTEFGEPGYDTRLDLNADGGINILDIFALFPVWLQTCTP